MQILQTTIPLFCFLIGGFLAKRFLRLSDSVSGALNKLTYYVGMPAMIFKGIASFEFAATFRLDLVACNLAVTATLFVLVFALAFLLRQKTRRGAFHLSAFRSNIGYIGMPVVQGFYGDAALSQVAVINGFDSPFCVFLSIFSLSVFRSLQGEDGDRAGARRLLAKNLLAFLYNPFLLATVLGLIVSYFRIPVMELPIAADCILMCADIALPLALISIGMSISLPALRHGAAALLSVCAIRLLLAPVIGYLFGRFLFGFAGVDLALTTLLCGTPVSVSSFVLASEMGADKNFSASAIGLSTLLSLITLSLLHLTLTHLI